MVRRSKKAMQANQIFIFVLSIVVVGLVLLFGTRAVMQWKDDVSDVKYIQFKTRLEQSLSDVAGDFGSVRQLEFSVPSEYAKICFADLDIDPPVNPDDFTLDGDRQPLLYNEWKEKTANIFFVSDVVEHSFRNDKVEVSDGVGIECFPVQGGTIQIRLEGKGRSVLVSRWLQ